MTLKRVFRLRRKCRAVVTMDRTALLEEALTLITGDRHDTYGEASQHFAEIARLWSMLLGQEIKPAQVTLCLAAIKLIRLSGKLDHQDSWVDLIGYAALGGELSNQE